MFDLVLENGAIFGNDDADTVAVRSGRIAYVGRGRRLESARTLDLQGRTLMPGFIDSHTHILNLGLSMNRLDLSAATNREDALEKAREYAGTSGSKVVVGYGWDETAWGESDYITSAELDFTEKPVILYRKDMHMAVLNSKAMELAGKKLEGGAFSEESLREVQWLSEPDSGEIRLALESAGKKAASEGITSVRDIMQYGIMGAIKESSFPVRVFGTLYDREFNGQDLSSRDWWGIKTFLDGSIGSRSAAHRGWDQKNLKFSSASLKNHLERFWKGGMPVAMHAIGEVAVSQAVDALSGHKGPVRNSIEHFELVEPEVLDNVGNSTVLSSQPNFLQWSNSGGLYENTLGAEWFGRDNPFRDIMGAGKNLAFGSDCMPMGPNYGMGLAVNSPHGRQRISLADAVRAYTEGGAFLLNMECCLGRIEQGHHADMVVQGSKFSSDTGSLCKTKPLATIRGGIFTYASSEFGNPE